MEKNPFSLYDFLGYVFPGVFALMVIYFFYLNSSFSLEQWSDYLKGLERLFVKIRAMKEWSLEWAVSFLVVSYFLGHLISFLSALTIERFSQWIFGYPSFFLLNKTKKNLMFHDIEQVWKKPGRVIIKCRCKIKLNHMKAIVQGFMRILVAILILPVSLLSLLCIIASLRGFFVKRLDSYLRDCIQRKKHILEDFYQLPHSHEYGDVDYFRIITHYTSEHSETHRRKMDNYMALFGFMRSCTFILSCTVMWLLMCNLFDVFKHSYGWSDFSLSETLVIVALSLLSFIFFMGFFKFYRKYSLEGLMFIVVSDDLIKRRNE